MEMPSTDQIKDAALKLFYHRVVNAPHMVKTSELVPVLTAILRLQGKTDGVDPLTQAMGDVTAANVGDAEGTEPSEEPEEPGTS